MADLSTDGNTAAAGTPARMTRAERAQARRLKRFENPWANPKLIWGVGLLLGIVALGLLGRALWNLDLVFTGSATLKLPPDQRCTASPLP